MSPPRPVEAGAIAGAVAAVVFLVAHAIWIVPIWQVAPVGLFLGAAGGMAIGSLRGRVTRGPRPWPLEAAGLFAACWLVLGPSVVLAELGLRAGVAPLPAVLIGLFGPASVIAAGMAVAAARSWRAAPAGAIVGAVLAAGPGHNIPLLAATPAVPTELAILAAVSATGALVFVLAERRLALAQPQSAVVVTR